MLALERFSLRNQTVFGLNLLKNIRFHDVQHFLNAFASAMPWPSLQPGPERNAFELRSRTRARISLYRARLTVGGTLWSL